MINELCNYMFGGHKKCKAELHMSLQHNLDALKEARALNATIEKYSDNIKERDTTIIQLFNQIQELKAINDYQTFELEKKIASLDAENRCLKKQFNACKCEGS